MEEKKCLECKRNFHGRSDKKFCSDGCRNAFNNQLNTAKRNYMRQVNSILRKNRLVLEALNKEGKVKKHRDQLLSKGFDFNYFTNTIVTKAGDTYKFCYEQGYLELDKGFYLLVRRNED
ncbi:MAG: hypothetical protein RIC03_03215 [Cyclobacteriaceae bacterium]